MFKWFKENYTAEVESVAMVSIITTLWWYLALFGIQNVVIGISFFVVLAMACQKYHGCKNIKGGEK